MVTTKIKPLNRIFNSSGVSPESHQPGSRTKGATNQTMSKLKSAMEAEKMEKVTPIVNGSLVFRTCVELAEITVTSEFGSGGDHHSYLSELSAMGSQVPKSKMSPIMKAMPITMGSTYKPIVMGFVIQGLPITSMPIASAISLAFRPCLSD